MKKRRKKNVSDLQELSELRRCLTESSSSPELTAVFFYALESLSEMVVVTDLEHNIVFVNAASREVLGYSPEDMLGRKSQDFFERIPGNPAELAEKVMQEAGDSIWRGEIFNRRKDGRLIMVSLKLTVLRDAAGRRLGYVGISEDITPRQQAEAALAQEVKDRKDSDEKYRALLNSTPAAIVLLSVPEFRILSLNTAMSNLLGGGEESLIGDKLESLYPKDIYERCEANMDKALKSGKLLEAEEERDGKIFYNQYIPLSLSDGSRALELLSTDITEYRRLETELLKSSNLESLGILVGGLAHDFNNLLAAIVGNILLVRMKLPEESQLLEILDDAELACFLAEKLTRQLLTFSKGGFPLKEPIRLGDIIEESTRFALRGSSVGSRFEIDQNLWPVDADRGQVGQVMHNLVINSSQAMPKGGLVTVIAENVELGKKSISLLPEGRYVRIKVKDTGTGIHEDIMDKIFDPYFTTKKTGRGLGLATVYSIMKKHEGIILASAEEEGAAFQIYFPALPDDVEIKEMVTGEIQRGGGRVLVMDDEELVLRTAERIIKDLDYMVETARDGREVIEKFEKFYKAGTPFDLVILDLTVQGGMGGREALAGLKALDPRVKAIVSSGYSNDSIISDYEKEGFSGVIAKPYTIKKLSRLLGDLSGQHE